MVELLIVLRGLVARVHLHPGGVFSRVIGLTSWSIVLLLLLSCLTCTTAALPVSTQTRVVVHLLGMSWACSCLTAITLLLRLRIDATSRGTTIIEKRSLSLGSSNWGEHQIVGLTCLRQWCRLVRVAHEVVYCHWLDWRLDGAPIRRTWVVRACWVLIQVSN